MENTTNTNLETSGQEGLDNAGAAEAKTYSEADVMALVQKESDKRVSQALAKAQAKWEHKMAEADKLRQMDETQRKEYEFESKLKEFEEQKKEFALTQNKLEASKVMSQRNLPIAFVDYIVAEDAESMMANINTFEKAFKSAVADAVSSKLASPTPKTGSVLQTGMSKEQFRKLTTSQQAELYRTNPELYKEMTQR